MFHVQIYVVAEAEGSRCREGGGIVEPLPESRNVFGGQVHHTGRYLSVNQQADRPKNEQSIDDIEALEDIGRGEKELVSCRLHLE